MTHTLVRKVLIRERELKKLKRQALVKSEYGNSNLYDSVEWRPITVKDLTLEILKGEEVNLNYIKRYIRKYTNSMYDRRYEWWDYYIIGDTVVVRPASGGTTYYEPFGWAILTKEFNK
jgi:hypothetical protein